MIATTQARNPVSVDRPTIWGLSPLELHDHFWAARGVQVVRQGERAPLSPDAELFLLTDPRTLAVFRLRRLVDLLSWSRARLLYVRLKSTGEQPYREEVVTDQLGSFVRFQRNYGGSDGRLARLALTKDRQLVRLWQAARDPRSGWRLLRRQVHRQQRDAVSITGRAYDHMADEEIAEFVRDLVTTWRQPSASVPGVCRIGAGVWSASGVPSDVQFIGRVWIGAGRTIPQGKSILGPCALWDDPAARPSRREVPWGSIEPTDIFAPLKKPNVSGSLYQVSKRAFDVVFALTLLVLTAPLYPLVLLAIWLEDGRPFFFVHNRETLHGRVFPCLKFRSMRKDAEKMKQRLVGGNQSDGPQFYMQSDPRLTRVGRFIRKCNIDELPQFVNVLLGQMSVVGPRPSPYSENQFCPAWREARLSVRPGVTGLWQVSRTRQQGLDFQEWIKYDLEYVSRAGWGLDLVILLKTAGVVLRGLFKS